jgi:hypothetical protein
MNRQNFHFLARLLLLQRSLVFKLGVSPSRSRLLTRLHSLSSGDNTTSLMAAVLRRSLTPSQPPIYQSRSLKSSYVIVRLIRRIYNWHSIVGAVTFNVNIIVTIKYHHKQSSTKLHLKVHCFDNDSSTSFYFRHQTKCLKRSPSSETKPRIGPPRLPCGNPRVPFPRSNWGQSSLLISVGSAAFGIFERHSWWQRPWGGSRPTLAHNGSYVTNWNLASNSRANGWSVDSTHWSNWSNVTNSSHNAIKTHDYWYLQMWADYTVKGWLVDFVV